MRGGTSAGSHGPPYPMSLAETSPSANSRPADRPSVAARPNLVGWTIRSTARPAHAAIQTTMPMTGGGPAGGLPPTHEKPSQGKPHNARPTGKPPPPGHPRGFPPGAGEP